MGEGKHKSQSNACKCVSYWRPGSLTRPAEMRIALCPECRAREREQAEAAIARSEARNG